MKPRVATSPLPLSCGWIRSPAEMNHSFTAVCGAIIRWKYHHHVQCTSDLSLLIFSKCLGNHLHIWKESSQMEEPERPHGDVCNEQLCSTWVRTSRWTSRSSRTQTERGWTSTSLVVRHRLEVTQGQVRERERTYLHMLRGPDRLQANCLCSIDDTDRPKSLG